MGLFDKFKNAIDTAKDSINKAIETASGSDDPLYKAYYDIVFNLLLAEKPKTLTQLHIIRFIEARRDGKCDIAVLEKVLTKFDVRTEPKQGKQWYRLPFGKYSKALENKIVSCYKEEEIYDICFADFREEIRSQFKTNFAIVMTSPSENVLRIGIDKIKNELPANDYNNDYPYKTVATQVIGEEIVKLYFKGNELIREICVGIPHFSRSINECKYSSDYDDYYVMVYAFVLRALHYNKYDENNGTYTSLTIEECSEAVSNSEYFQNRIKEIMEGNPFLTNDFHDKFTKEIFEYQIPHYPRTSNYDWRFWAVKNIRFADSVCALLLNKLSKEAEVNVENVEDAIPLMDDYISKKAENLAKILEKAKPLTEVQLSNEAEEKEE